jgi:hypothetical protein
MFLNNAVTAATGISSILEQINSSNKALLEASQPLRSIQRELDRVRKLTDFSTERAFRDLTKGWMDSVLEQQRWQKMTLPLEKLHASMSLNKIMAEALEGISHTSKLQDEINRLALTQAKLLGEVSFPWGRFDHISKTLAAQVAFTQSSHLYNIVESFDARVALSKSPFIAKSIKSILEQSEWAKQFHVPVIDTSAAAAIARLWGVGGIEKQLLALGIDYQTLLDNLDMEEPACGLEEPSQPTGSKLSLSDVLSIFSIILAVLIPMWQQYDSKRMEERLSGEIRQANEVQSKRLEVLERLLNRLLEENQLSSLRQEYVVRSRSAHIRKLPQSGSAILAEIFPNQVVTLLSEKGKWVKIEYFDWLAQECRSGWVLKKYLIRIPRARNQQ